ncbi:unnamed protein product [Rotaria socialis]|uniref:ATP-dependent DNA helicase n=1 Tax=Rotaria socialis TaxID=392032 RepID=A0A818E5D0_9BILA|nr:unnamed protein product [Rotaria socialis]CAF4663097.1 unnamed protein product [Rotaria socialis]
MKAEEIQEMFQCREENIKPIRIIDSYAYNNATTTTPIINPPEVLYGPERIIPCAENPTWHIEPYLEEKSHPWLYPQGKGGEADPERPLDINLRDYYKQRLKSSDNRWQKDPAWSFRALNLLQREDLRKSVNYHARKKYQDGKMCYLIYQDVGTAIRGSSVFWDKSRRHLRSMYATLGKPFIFLSINLQDDVEFLTNINTDKFGSINCPNWEATDSLNDDEYLICFEEYIKDKHHPFLIDYVVFNYFLKIEFQRDGLPHLHALLWVENPSSIDTAEGRQAIIDFVDKFLTTELPAPDTNPDLCKLVRKHQWHTHTFTCSKNKPIVRIRRGKKQLIPEVKDQDGDNLHDTNPVNRNNEDEIYEKVDAENDFDLIQTNIERREFFERARCRFGKPDLLAEKTHFRTYNQARILTRGDRDIIMKRTTQESRRIVPYNMNLLKTFRCNHDIQIITDPWAAAEYLFSYVSKEAHMEKDLVHKLAGCTCSSVEEAKKVLLKAGNAVLSHRQVGKIEAAWLILGIPLYRCSMSTIHLYISLPCNEDRILKNVNVNVDSISEDDFFTTIIHRYSQRPLTPEVINDLTLFEFAVWFTIDTINFSQQHLENDTLSVNPLWRTKYDQAPLLKTSRILPQPEINELHQILLKHQIQIYDRILTLPETYRIQLKNLLNHLINIDKEKYKINHRESYIFTNPINEEDDTISKRSESINVEGSVIHNEDKFITNVNNNTCLTSQVSIDLRNTANPQQKYLIDFIQIYLNHLLSNSRRPTHVTKPRPFHIVVNGLAGSGKSYVISIIENMLKEYCIAESAIISRLRKKFGLLKMAHTGKAALNIRGSTIHTALEICPDGSSAPNKLNSFKVHTLRNRFNGLLLIIIDEISLVSHALFQKINKRLNEIFRTSDKCDVYFGGIPMIVFGDMAQIEPVAAKQVFYRPLGEFFSLWHDLFRPINFDINMRQEDDRVFFNCLCRMRIGTKHLTSISQQDNPQEYKDHLKELNSATFEDAIHAYGLRKSTNLRNIEKLKQHASNTKNPIYMINAVDKVSMINTPFYKSSKVSHKACKINLKPSSDENKCGSLYQRLPICIGARVIIRRNIDQDNYVVNGTDAVVKEIVWEDSTDFLLPPTTKDDIFSALSNGINTKVPKYVELTLSTGQTYKLEPQETRFNDMNTISMSRLQLPLALGYTITIHRTQCMTYPKLVIDLGDRYWKPGMFYTVLSRTRQITDIIILAYDPKSFKAYSLKEIERLKRIEEEQPIQIDDYLCENNDITTSKTIYASNLTDVKESNRELEGKLEYPTKRFKTANNMNVDNEYNHVDDIITPEDAIICERQQDLFCGRHALRALLQDTEIFDDIYLTGLAEELAKQELQVRDRLSTFENFYSTNSEGYYHIQVIQNALEHQFNIELVQINTLSKDSCSHRNIIISHIHDVQALFIHQNDHYFCLRRFNGSLDYYFIIDSLRPKKHQTIHRNRIHDYIKYLDEHDSSIYVPVCSNIFKMENIPPDLLFSMIHPLSTCPADELALILNHTRNLYLIKITATD